MTRVNKTPHREAVEAEERQERIDLWAGMALLGFTFGLMSAPDHEPVPPEQMARKAYDYGAAMEAERDRRLGR